MVAKRFFISKRESFSKKFKNKYAYSDFNLSLEENVTYRDDNALDILNLCTQDELNEAFYKLKNKTKYTIVVKNINTGLILFNSNMNNDECSYVNHTFILCVRTSFIKIQVESGITMYNPQFHNEKIEYAIDFGSNKNYYEVLRNKYNIQLIRLCVLILNKMELL